MSICRHKFIALSAGLLMCGWAGAGEERTLSLGNCVSRVAEAGPLAIKICQARLARSIMNSGASACVGGRRVVQGRIHCNRRDSAANASGAVSEFEPYHTRLNGPVSIGSVEAFYAGRHAGDADRRFQVSGQSDGDLEIGQTGVSSGNEHNCEFGQASYHCTVSKTYDRRRIRNGGGNTYTLFTRDYLLRLDGLLVEDDVRRRVCTRRSRCFAHTCTSECVYSWVQDTAKTISRLYPWE